MERGNTNEGKIQFQKLGGGSFKLDRRTKIKPGQKFWAFPEQIPVNFRDTVVPVNSHELVVKEGKLKFKEPEKVIEYDFKLRPAKEEGLFHIVGKSGKILTEEPLEEDAAKKLLSEMNA